MTYRRHVISTLKNEKNKFPLKFNKKLEHSTERKLELIPWSWALSFRGYKSDDFTL
jgi:hypothetical protein